MRVVLFDQSLKEIARSSCPGGVGGCTTSVFPITLTAPAPMTAGTYVWAVGFYGNDYEASGASFGSGTSSTLKVGFFTADANNSGHGYQTVALPAFTVSAASAPAIALNPTSLDFQTVTVGAQRDLRTDRRRRAAAARGELPGHREQRSSERDRPSERQRIGLERLYAGAAPIGCSTGGSMDGFPGFVMLLLPIARRKSRRAR